MSNNCTDSDYDSDSETETENVFGFDSDSIKLLFIIFIIVVGFLFCYYLIQDRRRQVYRNAFPFILPFVMGGQSNGRYVGGITKTSINDDDRKYITLLFENKDLVQFINSKGEKLVKPKNIVNIRGINYLDFTVKDLNDIDTTLVNVLTKLYNGKEEGKIKGLLDSIGGDTSTLTIKQRDMIVNELDDIRKNEGFVDRTPPPPKTVKIAQDELDQLKNDRTMLADQLEKIKEHVKELDSKIAEKDKTIEGLNTKTKELEGQINGAITSRTECETSRTKVDEQIKTLNDEKASLENQLKQATDSKKAEIQKEITNKDTEIAKLQQSINDLDAKYKTLVKDIDQYQLQIKQLQESISGEQKQKQDLFNQLSDTPVKIQALLQENEHLRLSITDKEKEISKLSKELSDTQSNASTEAKKTDEEFNRRMTEFTRELEKLALSDQKINESLTNLKGQDTTLEEKITKLESSKPNEPISIGKLSESELKLLSDRIEKDITADIKSDITKTIFPAAKSDWNTEIVPTIKSELSKDLTQTIDSKLHELVPKEVKNVITTELNTAVKNVVNTELNTAVKNVVNTELNTAVDPFKTELNTWKSDISSSVASWDTNWREVETKMSLEEARINALEKEIRGLSGTGPRSTSASSSEIDDLKKRIEQLEAGSGSVAVMEPVKQNFHIQNNTLVKNIGTFDEITMYDNDQLSEAKKSKTPNKPTELSTIVFSEILGHVMTKPKVHKYFAVSAISDSPNPKVRIVTGNRYEFKKSSANMVGLHATDQEGKKLGCTAELCSKITGYKTGERWELYQLYG
jgi:predicted  nucleic acid-binding Zn-ribbon protein